MELYACCSGEWEDLARATQVDAVSLDAFLTYAATFLSNIGNYYVNAQSLIVSGHGSNIVSGYRRSEICAKH